MRSILLPPTILCHDSIFGTMSVLKNHRSQGYIEGHRYLGRMAYRLKGWVHALKFVSKLRESLIQELHPKNLKDSEPAQNLKLPPPF